MQADRRNMERIVEFVPNSDWQALQNFTSHSPWDAFALMDQIAIDVNALIGCDADSCLIIDESGFGKKGNKSVGVARQWNGRQGKVDNCQVGVFAALNCREYVSLINTRLFLPESWTDDSGRCKEAGIPDDRLDHCKKTELAFELIESARSEGLRYQWIGADGFYGNDPEFLRQIDQLGETFMIDIHSDQTIYLADPKPHIPMRKSKRGRIPSLLTTNICSTTVSQWALNQGEDAWEEVELRDSTTGTMKVKVLHRQVWLWDGEENQAHLWHLVVRKENGSKNKMKYSISNAPANTPLSRLAFMQGQRYFVERAIEDAKSTAGLADYQVRGWTAWHHHMAMVMLAMLFMLTIKIKYKHDYEIMSCNDIRELLYHFLPKRAITKEEVIQQMLIRHKKRKYTIQFHYKKQKSLKSD